MTDSLEQVSLFFLAATLQAVHCALWWGSRGCRCVRAITVRAFRLVAVSAVAVCVVAVGVVAGVLWLSVLWPTVLWLSVLVVWEGV
jgi:hypothetical protein